MNKALIIAAHPDDEVLGVGGTIAKLSQNEEFYILIVTEGCSSQYKDKDYKRIISEKKESSMKAAEILGARDVLFGDLPDMRLDTVPHTEVNAVIEKALSLINPDTVFTHHYGDVNLDHRMVYNSTMVAARPTEQSSVKKLYTYETLSSTEWQNLSTDMHFSPNTYIEIENTLQKKIDALNAYSVELRKYPHPRSPEAIINLARYRGQTVGVRSAEAFSLIREIIK